MKKVSPILGHINVPNAITTFGLIFGVLACYYLFEGGLREVLICLFFASMMDVLDGYFAMKLKQQTLFGKYADSLTDFFICCIIPALMAFVYLDRSVFLVICVGAYCVCGMWRLANYNLTITEKQTHFTGIPVPSALFITTAALWCQWIFEFDKLICTVVYLVMALLMISPIKLKKYGSSQILIWLVAIGFFTWVLLFGGK